MTTAGATLSIAELKNRVENDGIHTVIAGFADHYGRLMGKRFDADFFIDQVAEHGTHACNYLMTTDAEMEPVEATASQTGNSATVTSI